MPFFRSNVFGQNILQFAFSDQKSLFLIAIELNRRIFERQRKLLQRRNKGEQNNIVFFSPCLFRFYQRTLCLGDSQQSTLTVKYMCVCGVCVFVCPPFSLAMFVFVYCSVGPWREQKNYNSLVILVLAWISESRHCFIIESSPLSVLSRCPACLKTCPQCN